MDDRFELREGKFGFYFFDTITKQDLPLKHVLAILNNCVSSGETND